MGNRSHSRLPSGEMKRPIRRPSVLFLRRIASIMHQKCISNSIVLHRILSSAPDRCDLGNGSAPFGQSSAQVLHCALAQMQIGHSRPHSSFEADGLCVQEPGILCCCGSVEKGWLHRVMARRQEPVSAPQPGLGVVTSLHRSSRCMLHMRDKTRRLADAHNAQSPR